MPDAILREIRQTRPFHSVEEAVLVGLQLAAHRVMAPWARILSERTGLTPTQYNLLRIVRGAGAPGRTCTEIAERLITRDPDVSRLLVRLAKRGLVRRRPDPGDRRVGRIRITARGRALLARLDPVVAQLPGRLLRGLTRRRLRELHGLLAGVIEAVHQSDLSTTEGAAHEER